MSLARFFDSFYAHHPVSASFIEGVEERLPDWSPEGLAAAAAEMRAVRAALLDERREREPTRTPDIETMALDCAARDRELAISVLDVQLAEDATTHFQRGNPSLAVGEAAFGIVFLLTAAVDDMSRRVDAIIGRLEAIPDFLAGVTRSIAVVPEPWRQKCAAECVGLDLLLGSGIGRWIAGRNVGVRGAPIERAADRARAALAEFRKWLSAVPDAGADGGRAGPELFDRLLTRGHWCPTPRHELTARSADAFEEALARLHERARRRAPGGWPEVQERLAEDHPEPSEYLATFQEIWDRCRACADAHDLVTWPDAPIRYVPIPPETREAAPHLYYLFYRSPSPKRGRRVHDYVVPSLDADMPADERRRRLRATNRSVIKLNHVVHHGAIGHHVQNHHAYAGESAIGRVAAVDCASRIAMFLGGTMAEGWACYATDLMDEVGFLTEDESIAQQHTRARLLARAVVDLGFHTGSLTFDQAVAVYRDRVGMSPEAARAEACKNSMFPATAIMYWLGTEGLHELRDACERRDGARFSRRRFHDQVLSFGSIPVSLVSRLVRCAIA
jgi:hypothetical protein